MFLLDQSGNGYLEYNFMSKWFYDIFLSAATGSVNYGFFIRNDFSLLVVSY
jgi:hypothetical protein